MKSVFLTTVGKFLQAHAMSEQSIPNIPMTFLTSLFYWHQIRLCDHETLLLSERRTEGTGINRLSASHTEKFRQDMVIIERHSLVISKTGKCIPRDNSTNQPEGIARPENSKFLDPDVRPPGGPVYKSRKCYFC